MHELSVTSKIVENLLEGVERRNARRVHEVHLVIGKFTFLGIEQVNFSYSLLTKGTPLEDSKLLIEETDARVKCNSCGYEGAIKYEEDASYHIALPTLSCPQCKSVVEVVGGQECLIKKVKMEV